MAATLFMLLASMLALATTRVPWESSSEVIHCPPDTLLKWSEVNHIIGEHALLQASFSPIFTPQYTDKPRQCPPPAPASASALEGKIQFIIEIKNPT